MQIVIIGNSAAGLNALDSFRRLDPDTAVTVVSAEPGPAYSRVLLPYFLRGRVAYERLFVRGEQDYRRLRARCLFGARVEMVEASQNRLRLGRGRFLAYDRLLVATGGRPIKPPIPGLEDPAVFHLWTLQDALDLQPLLRPGRRLLVLGSGFVALQAAWAAVARRLNVTVFELLPRIMPKTLDGAAAGVLADQVRAHGVDLRTGLQTEAVERDSGGRLRVTTRGGTVESFDLLIVATGVRANTELVLDSLPGAAAGIPVDARMQTPLANVFAAGDVALGPTAYGEPHESHALWPTAVEHGKVAGQEMAGHRTAYRGSLNFNVTQMFGVTVASMGCCSDEAPTGKGLEVWERVVATGPRYVRILTRNGIPIGASAIGDSAEAALLGQLRPFIRLGRPLSDPQRFILGGATPPTWRRGEGFRPAVTSRYPQASARVW
jgi:NADPH-dependent 2,4-dienoyl-CoA reductase/sulfur reductase-like enzyme